MTVFLPFVLQSAGKIDGQSLWSQVQKLERALPHSRLGVAVKDLRTGETWSFREGEAFPMQSVFKLPLGVFALHSFETGRIAPDETMTVERTSLSVPYSWINEHFKGPAEKYPVRRLVELAVGTSDNTAADLLLDKLGGPHFVTSELTKLGMRGIRIDRWERDLQRENAGLGPMRPEWTGDTALAAAIAHLPGKTKVEAMNRYLRDQRDTASPLGMMAFLNDLDAGVFLRPASRKWLFKVMTDSTTGMHRLKAGLPAGAIFAHKTGTGREIAGRSGAVNDAGIVTLPNGRRIIIVAFLTGAGATSAVREKTLASVARAVVRAVH